MGKVFEFMRIWGDMDILLIVWIILCFLFRVVNEDSKFVFLDEFM